MAGDETWKLFHSGKGDVPEEQLKTLPKISTIWWDQLIVLWPFWHYKE